MIREVKKDGIIIKYELIRKRVKNINLRVKPDKSVVVSAPSRVSVKYIDSFVLSKYDFIEKALNDYSQSELHRLTPNYSVKEFSEIIIKYFNEVYERFLPFGIDKPTLKMSKMKSRWGSCNYVKRVITLSTNLIYCTEEQIYYVVVHEFSHLLVHNHSSDFYDIVVKFCPDYKRIRKEMNSIILK